MLRCLTPCPAPHPAPAHAVRSCTAPITKLEPVQRGAGQLFVSPATLQGFRTEADFTKHVAHVKQSLPAHRPPAS